MTNEIMQLQSLLEKSPDADMLREMIGFASHRLMELEVGALTGAAHGEKSRERLAQRNGYCDWDWGEARPAIGPRAAGRTGRGRWSCASPNSGRGAICRSSFSRAGRRRRR